MIEGRQEPDLTWRGWAWGHWYQARMRIAHRFGYCYPEPTLINPENVWCHWCGMRGHRAIVDEATIAAAMSRADEPTPS